MKNLFENLKKRNRAALILYVSCGDPSIEFSEKLVERACEAGADIIELGVPFSDPMTGGKTIQASSAKAIVQPFAIASSAKAIANGCTLRKIIDMASRLRAKGIEQKFVVFSYYNPIFKYGVERAAKECAEAGINSWQIVDVPMEESVEVSSVLNKYGMDFIPLATTTSSPERVHEISECGSGFIYYADATDSRDSLPESVLKQMQKMREASVLPVGAGFGFSSESMANQAAKCADAVVVVNKFVEVVNNALEANGEDFALDTASEFVKKYSLAMQRD